VLLGGERDLATDLSLEDLERIFGALPPVTQDGR
jgi:hypothetical protein